MRFQRRYLCSFLFLTAQTFSLTIIIIHFDSSPAAPFNKKLQTPPPPPTHPAPSLYIYTTGSFSHRTSTTLGVSSDSISVHFSISISRLPVTDQPFLFFKELNLS